MCVLSIEVPIRKKSGNLFKYPRIYIYIYIWERKKNDRMAWIWSRAESLQHEWNVRGIAIPLLLGKIKKWFLHGRNDIVTWYPAETIEIRLVLSSRWNEQWQTVKKECRSQRGYQQMLVLSNLRSPDTREKEGEAKWLTGALKRKWHLLPVGEKNEKKWELFGRVRSGQTNQS